MLVETARRMRHKMLEDTYNPLGNNCQHLWTTGLLEAIVCQCSDRPRLQIPWSAEKRWASGNSGAAIGHRVADLIIVLAKRRYLGMPWVQPWTAWSNVWVHILSEVGKYYVLWQTLTDPGVKLLSFRDPERGYIIEHLLENHKGWRGTMTQHLPSLQVLLVLLCLLDTVLGSLYRFHGSWGALEWASIALGNVVLVITHRLRDERRTAEDRVVGCKASFVVGYGEGKAP